MIDLIWQVIAGPSGIYAVLAAAIGTALLWARQSGKQSERNAQKAEQADAYEQHLKDIAAAGSARPRGGVLEDLNNRDNR